MDIPEFISSVRKAEAVNRRNVSDAMRIYISYRLYAMVGEALREVWEDAGLRYGGLPDVYCSYGDVFATDPQLEAMPDSDIKDLFHLIEAAVTRRMEDEGLADHVKVHTARQKLSPDRVDILFDLPRDYKELSELYAIASKA